MAKFTWDHIHLRTTDPEAMARWFEKTLGAEVLRTMQQGKPRIDLKIGGANIFIAPVAPGDRVNAAPTTPYRGLDHFGLAVTGIDAIAADLKAKGVEFTREPTTIRPGVRCASSADPREYRSSCSTAMSISGDSARRLSSSRFRRRRTDGRPADGAGDQGAHQEAARRRSAVRTLKSGGHVRVVVITDESGKSKLSFEYPVGSCKRKGVGLLVSASEA